MDPTRIHSAARTFSMALALLILMNGCQTQPAPPATSSASGFVDLNGQRVYYQRSGAGPPLLLVHGWGADIQTNWVDSGWIAALIPYRTVIAIDVRGHGRSSKPHALAPYSYEAMSQDVLAVMETLQIAHAELMGYSMGAFIGAHLLGHYPYVDSADRLAAALPNGQHVRIPDTDHLSVVADSRFKAAVLEFLRDNQPAERRAGTSCAGL